MTAPESLQKLLPLLFMMIGPIKLIPAFAMLSGQLDAPLRRQLALRSAMFAMLAATLAMLVGFPILSGWGASPAALAAAAGLLLLLASLPQALGKEQPGPPPSPTNEQQVKAMAVAPLAFPLILPPYAVGLLVLFAAYEPTVNMKLSVIGAVFVLMLLNFAAMIYARQLLGWIGVTTFQVLGAVFGVLQIALAIEMILWAVAAAFSAAPPVTA